MISCEFENGDKASLRHVVVDALVLKDGKVLMVKRSLKLLEGGKWGLIGGYMERDETLPQAAAREIMEETGWQVRDFTLLAVIDKPNRLSEDRQNVAFLYFCEAVEKTGEPDWESTEQKWFDFGELPPIEQIAFDHADHIKLYQKYLSKPFPVPFLN